MKTSENCNEIVGALCKFQSQLKSVQKDATAHKYKYATLNAIWDEIRPLLSENGLYIFQDVCTENGDVNVLTRIFHISGEWIETGYINIPMGKRDAHSTGSAQTYGRRYSLSAALGIVSDDDDDGHEAQRNPPQEQKHKPSMKPINAEEWLNSACEMFPEYEMEIDQYIKDLMDHTKKTREKVIQLLGQDDNAFKVKFNQWLKSREEPNA